MLALKTISPVPKLDKLVRSKLQGQKISKVRGVRIISVTTLSSDQRYEKYPQVVITPHKGNFSANLLNFLCYNALTVDRKQKCLL
jgi:hypothetical protein